MQRVVILEDELIAATELEKMLNDLQERRSVEKVLSSVEDSIAWLQSYQEPDVILSDIILSDGICFDIFKQVRVSCPVIFCTAYDKYAIEAFRNNGIDYLLKPISPFNLAQSFAKLESIQCSFTRVNDFYKDMQRLMERSDAFYPSAILCHFREQIIPLPTASINYISSEGRLVQIYTELESYIINKTLDQLMLKLNPYQFFRANRNYIIHRNAIQSIRKTTGRKLNVKLINPDSPVVSIGKGKVSGFIKWLEGTFPE